MKIENDFNELNSERERFTQMSCSLDGKSLDLTSEIEGLMDERTVGRQTNALFETKMESISEEMNEVKVKKESLKYEDDAIEKENNQLWVEADVLQKDKDKVCKAKQKWTFNGLSFCSFSAHGRR